MVRNARARKERKTRNAASFSPPSGLPAISPSRGEIALKDGFRQLCTLQIEAASVELPISPLEGEMAGKPEGGARSATLGFSSDERPEP
jgi:hypothetical protein